MELQEELEYAKDRVNDLRGEIANVKSALESLEGAIDDVSSLDNINLTWHRGEPDIVGILSSLDIETAEFRYEFQETL